MSQNPSVNQTIIKMVNDLRATGNAQNNDSTEFSTPLKRSCSTNSNDSSIEERSVKRVKRETFLNSSYIVSPQETRRLRVDIVEARNLIMNLENRIAHAHSIRKEMQLLFETETESLKRQHEHDKRSIENLEQQTQNLRKREAELKKELSKIKDKYSGLKSNSENTIFELEKDLNHVKDESKTVELEDNIESSKLKRRITELESMFQAAQEDAEAQKKLASELSKQLSEKTELEQQVDLKEVAYQKLKRQLQTLEHAKDEYLEFQLQAKTQAAKLAKYYDLEKENEQLKADIARIRDDIRNKILMEEENYDLKGRIAKYKDMEKNLVDLQTQNAQNLLYLNEWRAVARGICESTESDLALPHLLRATIERLQQQELSLTSEKVDYEMQLKTEKHAAKVAKTELEKTLNLVKELKTTGEQKQNLIHRMQKKLLLVSRERDSYRLQLDSYERDLTLINTAAGGAGDSLAHTQKERIDSLEKTIEGYRDMVARLENDLQKVLPNIHEDLTPLRADQVGRLQDEVEKLRNENDKLRERKDRLEIQLENLMEGQDTFHGGQQVVHANQNPLSQVLAQRGMQLEQLQQENLQLKIKLKKMEEGIETSKMGDISICPNKVQELKEQIKTNEKQTQRLKEYFKSQMTEFRNIIYMLFGFKIDKTSNSNIYKLRSMYAEAENDQLWFEINSEGELNLLENEFSSSLGSMIELHLMHQRSIPMFLSAITMDLFQQKTITKTINLV